MSLVKLPSEHLQNNSSQLMNVTSNACNCIQYNPLTAGYYQPLYGYYQPLYGYYQPFYGYSASSEPYYPMKVRPVESGWIVFAQGKEHVFTDTKDLAKFVIDTFKKEEKK